MEPWCWPNQTHGHPLLTMKSLIHWTFPQAQISWCRTLELCQVRVRVALPLALVWITGHHPLLNATIQVTSDEMHEPIGGGVYS